MRAPTSARHKKIYVSGKLCYYLYYACDFLFEDIDEFDFADLLNMRPLHHEEKEYGKKKKKKCKIKICSKQEDKFCYLLYMISETLQFPIEERDIWLDFICEATGLSKSYYRSYHLRVKRSDKKDDENFVSEIGQVFENSKPYRNT